jgi:hypothetical protein
MSAEATRRSHWPHDLHCQQPRRVSGDTLDHSGRRIELKLSVRCSMRSPPSATERVKADFLLRIDQTNVPLAGSNESGSARTVLRLGRGRSASPSPAATPIRRSIPRRSRPPRCSPAATWTTILTIPSTTHRITRGAAVAVAVAVEWCVQCHSITAARGSSWLTRSRAGQGSPGVRPRLAEVAPSRGNAVVRRFKWGLARRATAAQAC